MKKLIAPALLAVLALTGCSAAETPPGPREGGPTEAQKTALLAELVKVNPQLEGPRAVAGAIRTCSSILRGESEEVQIMSVRDRFALSGQPLTDPDAKRILEVIKANGFCVKA